MEGLQNTISVVLVFGGAAAFLWLIDKALELFGEHNATKARHSSKFSYLIIGVTVVGVVFALNSLDSGSNASSGDDSGCVGSMRC
jgi:hypothetical protein